MEGENSKHFFNDKKNIAILVLSILLLISFCVYGSTSTKENISNTINQEETIKQKENQITNLQKENRLLKDEKQKIESEKKTLEDEKQSLNTQIEELKNKISTTSTNKNTTVTNKNIPASSATSTKTTSKTTNTTTKTTTSQDTNSQIVYITNTGKKYHKSGCSYLRKSKIETTLTKAQSQGYTACSKCY